MKKLMVLLIVACLSLVLAAPAQAGEPRARKTAIVITLNANVNFFTAVKALAGSPQAPPESYNGYQRLMHYCEVYFGPVLGFGAGSPVTIKNQGGVIVGTGSMTKVESIPTYDPATLMGSCEFKGQATATRSKFYQATVGFSTSPPFSHKRLINNFGQMEWTVS